MDRNERMIKKQMILNVDFQCMKYTLDQFRFLGIEPTDEFKLLFHDNFKQEIVRQRHIPNIMPRNKEAKKNG